MTNLHIRPRLLVVEDDRDMAFALQRNLAMEGFDVTTASDGRAGLEAVRTVRPDIIILDVMLPRIDGFRVLSTLRAEGWETPVLLLTARSSEPDKVFGFRIGADDYVAKPFGLQELISRVRALVRRANRSGGVHPTNITTITFGAIEIDITKRIVRRNGQEINLSPRAYELLLTLHHNLGATVSRTDLMTAVWGYAVGAASRTLDAHIAELRRKLEEYPNEPRHILTVRKIGYRLVD